MDLLRSLYPPESHDRKPNADETGSVAQRLTECKPSVRHDTSFWSTIFLCPAMLYLLLKKEIALSFNNFNGSQRPCEDSQS